MNDVLIALNELQDFYLVFNQFGSDFGLRKIILDDLQRSLPMDSMMHFIHFGGEAATNFLNYLYL